MSTNGDMPRVRVAVDAMGGDFGPRETVPGVLAALDAHPELTVILVGDHDAVAGRVVRSRPYRPSRFGSALGGEG